MTRSPGQRAVSDEAGHQVTRLVLFDVHGPGCFDASRQISPIRQKIVRELERVRNHWMNLQWRDRHQRLAYVREVACTAYQRTLQRITRGRRDNRPENIQRVSRVDRQAVLGHSRQPTHVPITLFRARIQYLGRPVSRAVGWEKLSRGEIQVLEVAGYHGELCHEPYVRHWFGQLDACLLDSGSTRELDLPNSDIAHRKWVSDMVMRGLLYRHQPTGRRLNPNCRFPFRGVQAGDSSRSSPSGCTVLSTGRPTARSNDT